MYSNKNINYKAKTKKQLMVLNSTDPNLIHPSKCKQKIKTSKKVKFGLAECSECCCAKCGEPL